MIEEATKTAKLSSELLDASQQFYFLGDSHYGNICAVAAKLLSAMAESERPDRGTDWQRGYASGRQSLTAEVEYLRAIETALNTRDLFINPNLLKQAADEIDCCPGCDVQWVEADVNASGCKASEDGKYCPNDVAETLRAVAKAARLGVVGGKLQEALKYSRAFGHGWDAGQVVADERKRLGQPVAVEREAELAYLVREIVGGPDDYAFGKVGAEQALTLFSRLAESGWFKRAKATLERKPR